MDIVVNDLIYCLYENIFYLCRKEKDWATHKAIEV